MRKILNKEELLDLAIKFAGKTNKSTGEVKDWTEFVIEAISVGAKQDDIDYYSLSDREYFLKYKPEKQKND